MTCLSALLSLSSSLHCALSCNKKNKSQQSENVFGSLFSMLQQKQNNDYARTFPRCHLFHVKKWWWHENAFASLSFSLCRCVATKKWWWHGNVHVSSPSFLCSCIAIEKKWWWCENVAMLLSSSLHNCVVAKQIKKWRQHKSVPVLSSYLRSYSVRKNTTTTWDVPSSPSSSLCSCVATKQNDNDAWTFLYHYPICVVTLQQKKHGNVLASSSSSHNYVAVKKMMTTRECSRVIVLLFV